MVEARPPGWMTRLPITAMNLYGSSLVISPAASFVIAVSSAPQDLFIVLRPFCHCQVLTRILDKTADGVDDAERG